MAVAPGSAIVDRRAGSNRLHLTRDSKNPDGPVLAFTSGEWNAFLGGVRAGEFDRLS